MCTSGTKKSIMFVMSVLNIFLIGDLEAVTKNSKHGSMMKFINSHMYMPSRTQSVLPSGNPPIISVIHCLQCGNQSCSQLGYSDT